MKKFNLITASLLVLGLTACSSEQSVNIAVEQVSAPGAPGVEPFWAYSGKTGIGTSYEQYQVGHYSDAAATGKVSKVWFSIAKGMITETMFGLIHQALQVSLHYPTYHPCFGKSLRVIVMLLTLLSHHLHP